MSYSIDELYNLVLEDQFHILDYSFSNAYRDDIAPLLSIYGYTSEKIAVGQELLSRAIDLHLHQQQSFGNQISATQRANDIRTHVAKRTDATRKIANLAITIPALRRKLGLYQTKKRTNKGWFDQTDSFYRNCDSEILAHLSEYGYTESKIEEERQLVQTVLIAEKAQEDFMVAARAATAQRNSVVADLHHWTRTFFKVCRIALEDRPELLQYLSIRPKKEKRTATEMSENQ